MDPHGYLAVGSHEFAWIYREVDVGIRAEEAMITPFGTNPVSREQLSLSRKEVCAHGG